MLLNSLPLLSRNTVGSRFIPVPDSFLLPLEAFNRYYLYLNRNNTVLHPFNRGSCRRWGCVADYHSSCCGSGGKMPCVSIVTAFKLAVLTVLIRNLKNTWPT